MEWIEDYEEAEPQHRHTSHLFGLHPGSMITTATPELMEAARKVARSAAATAAPAGAWPGRSTSGAACTTATTPTLLLINLLKDKTLPNLFDNHPPFQIDGNFGAPRRLPRCCCRATSARETGDHELHLLPALPGAWPSGSVNGLRARGGFEVDICWKDGRLAGTTIRSTGGTACEVRQVTGPHAGIPTRRKPQTGRVVAPAE